MSAIAEIIAGIIKGVGGIAGGALSARRMTQDAKKQAKLAEDIFAETKDKPLYELTPETQARENKYRMMEQGPGFRFRSLGQSADKEFARMLSGLGKGATSGTQLMAALSGATQRAGDRDNQAIGVGASEMDKASALVDKYVMGREAANELNWGVELGDVLRREQLVYDYLAASTQNRANAFNALAGVTSSAIDWGGNQVSKMNQLGMFDGPSKRMISVPDTRKIDFDWGKLNNNFGDKGWFKTPIDI
jgi:hypothetical protein